MTDHRQQIKGTLLLNDSPEAIKLAVRILREGGLVAFPTETVYGLGALATDAAAVKKIFMAKGRPADNPLIVHIADACQLKQVAVSVPEVAQKLIDRFWPGPLSLVLPRSKAVPDEVTAGLNTVAVRIPDHPVALNLLRACGFPVAAPSANRSGKPSPTTYKHVLTDLCGRINAVIKSKGCPIGVESTVLDLTSECPVILRPGGISREELEEAMGCAVMMSPIKDRTGVPRSPGMKYRHYSPRAPLILISGNRIRRRSFILALVKHLRLQGFKVGLLNRSMEKLAGDAVKAEELAATLYSNLRSLDKLGVDLILAEGTEEKGLGLAVMNRLRKAASKAILIK